MLVPREPESAPHRRMRPAPAARMKEPGWGSGGPAQEGGPLLTPPPRGAPCSCCSLPPRRVPVRVSPARWGRDSRMMAGESGARPPPPARRPPRARRSAPRGLGGHPRSILSALPGPYLVTLLSPRGGSRPKSEAARPSAWPPPRLPATPWPGVHGPPARSARANPGLHAALLAPALPGELLLSLQGPGQMRVLLLCLLPSGPRGLGAGVLHQAGAQQTGGTQGCGQDPGRVPRGLRAVTHPALPARPL